jgi:aspartate 1-decarboxylase
MQVQILKSKIHRARVTQCELQYEGSLGIDLDLMEAAGMYPYEKILVVNANNGERLTTYAIPAERGSRTFCLNGAAARKGFAGDVITIMSFALCSPEEAAAAKPVIIVLDADNVICNRKGQ